MQLIKFALTQAHGLDGLPIRDIPARMGCDILVCAVERGKTVTIPDGSFVLRSGDLVTFLATPDKAQQFFRKLGIPTAPVNNAMIGGGGAIAFYSSGTWPAATTWPRNCPKPRSCARTAPTAASCSARGWARPKPLWP